MDEDLNSLIDAARHAVEAGARNKRYAARATAACKRLWQAHDQLVDRDLADARERVAQARLRLFALESMSEYDPAWAQLDEAIRRVAA